MMECYEFEVSLRGLKPRVWRRFRLKKTATFQDLHEAIQDSCGWENCHLFSFTSDFGRFREEIASGNPMGESYEGAEAPPATQVKLKSYFEHSAKCGYTYDFGDDWEHDVKCKPVTSSEKFTRKLIAGQGLFPPEDCGGLYGYQRCLDILSGKEEDEDDLKEWLGDWSPDDFSLDETMSNFDA